MKKVCLVTPLAKHIPDFEGFTYVGVDAGAYRLLEENKTPSFAIGDFDSMSQEELKSLQQICPLVQHPIMKDQSDTELAIETVLEQGAESIIVYGALGSRIDHSIANIRLMMYRYPQIVLMDEFQVMTVLTQGQHTIENTHPHVSFFPIEPSILSLQGFLYSLSSASLEMTDIYTLSNTIVEKKGTVIVEKGQVLCVQSSYK